MKFTNGLKPTIINYYYLITVIIYFCAMYLPFIRVGLFMSFIMGIGIFILYKNKKFKLRKGLDILVLAYIIYNLASFVFFIFSDIPVSAFFREFSNSILPIILFYFFGRLYENNFFYKVSLFSLVACFIVGFYFQYTVPENYAVFMSKIDGVSTNPLNFVVNYRSFLGLTATGSLSAIGVLLSFGLLYKSNFKAGKITLVVSLVALILTFRRAALYTGVFAVLWMNSLWLFKLKGSKVKLLIFEFLFIFSVLYWLTNSNPDFLSDILERFNSFSEAFNERSSSWSSGLSHTQYILVGDGLGRYGHKAVEYSDIHIPDGNYFRMIAELGVIGFSIFMLIIFKTLYNGFSRIKNNYVELGIVIMVCMQAVGSDIFSFQLVAPIFWYSIGRCSRFTYLNKKSSLEDISKEITH